MTDDEALIARLSPDSQRRNGVPSPDDAAARQRAAVIAGDALADLLVPGGVRTSPLGPGWSSDLDLHVRTLPAPARLLDLGWLPLDDLLRRIGSRGRGRWAVIEGGEVLTSADFHLDPPPDPLQAVLSRCLRRREVRLREVLELRALARDGAVLPGEHPVVRAACGPRTPPIPVHHRQWAAPLGALRRAARPRYVVAVSGVDGSGKSTIAGKMAAQLRRAGVPTTQVWTRPGMGLGPMEHVAVTLKRLLHQAPAPGVRAMAEGSGAGLRSRRGVVGWVWAMVVTGAYVADVRRRHARARGVVIYDRHLADALATLDFAYEGSDLRLARAVVRYLLPRAAVTLYLDVPAEVAVARKPGDTLGELAVRRQLRSYADWRPVVPRLTVLDGTRPAHELAAEALSVVLGMRP